ncbi:luciferin 4-monooxygenase-like isoform X2 [Rhodnius prolixus]|uniref:luciferin 4-monooxygenase-like isoform X2 n=1 Tax=Rhodnius prolixus TaxID=13249 RepID=UPI003D187D4A
MTDEEGNQLIISGPPQAPFDTNICLQELLLTTLRKHNVKSIAQVEVETSRELTYGHLIRECLSVVQGLKAEGVGEGTVMAVISFNSQEAHVITLAGFFLGATMTPIDPSLTPDEISYLLEMVNPMIVYTEGGKTLRKTEAALANLSFEPLLIVSGKQKHPYTSFQALLQPTDPEFRPTINDPEEHISFILFTSGTTGLPKGVQLTNSYLINLLNAAHNKMELTSLLTSPLFWLTGVKILFTGLFGGWKMVFVRGPVKENVVLSTIQNYKVNVWSTSPTALQGILVSPYKNAYDLSSLMIVYVAGACLGADSTLKMQKEIFRNRTPILQAYGMTEIGIVSVTTLSYNKPGSCGILRPGYSCKIESLENGEPLGPEMQGEICIKGPYLMKGYINNPEATAAVYDEDDWFHTGDIGYYDEDCFLYVVDRLKDLIKYKSYQIAPTELENVLKTHPAVGDVAVFGMPHPIDGDHAIAFVAAVRTVSETELLEFVAERVSPNKQLRGGIRFVEFIPHTATGKPKRRALRAQLIAEMQNSKGTENEQPTG